MPRQVSADLPPTHAHACLPAVGPQPTSPSTPTPAIVPHVQGFDVNRFVQERTPSWTRLERLLREVERGGLASMNLAGAREFGKLYRAVSSDLIRARTEQVNATLTDYLNDVVARCYSVIHTREGRPERRALTFLLEGFPRLFRAEWRAMALSASILVAGALVGATFVAIDPQSLGALIPDQHQVHTPAERVGREEVSGGNSSTGEAVAFSGFLFTHNIQVTFVVFALGITFGVGTVALLFYNGVPLGALAMQYQQQGLATFFWAWILPHGIAELTEVFIAGGAGLLLARGLWLPGRRTRLAALSHEAKRGVALVLGGMPILILAGVIEGTVSQVHEPTLSYSVKLAFAAVVGAGVYYYLLMAGRNPRAQTGGDAQKRSSRLSSSLSESPPPLSPFSPSSSSSESSDSPPLDPSSRRLSGSGSRLFDL